MDIQAIGNIGILPQLQKLRMCSHQPVPKGMDAGCDTDLVGIVIFDFFSLTF